VQFSGKKLQIFNKKVMQAKKFNAAPKLIQSRGLEDFQSRILFLSNFLGVRSCQKLAKSDEI